MKPLCIDLFCGLGGWSEGFLAEGWDCVGFDIECHDYGSGGYPGQLVLQDILTIHGSQFRNADCIVASPPCQEYSYMAMPWSRAKAKAALIRAGECEECDGTGNFYRHDEDGDFLPCDDCDGTGKGDSRLKKLTALFDACFRVQREACAAAGRHIPMVVENVKGAQPWVGHAQHHYGSFYLWGDVPAIMPRADQCAVKLKGQDWSEHGRTGEVSSHWRLNAIKQTGLSGPEWFNKGLACFSSNSEARKAASALIAMIPFELSSHIARVFKPLKQVAA